MNEEESAEAAGEALEQALLKATRAVESELSRVIRTGEADVERLARLVAETLAQLAFDGMRAGATPAETYDTAGGSLNQIAAAVARAAIRGARFT